MLNYLLILGFYGIMYFEPGPEPPPGEWAGDLGGYIQTLVEALAASWPPFSQQSSCGQQEVARDEDV